MAKGIVEAIENLVKEVDKNRQTINELVENLNNSLLVKERDNEEIEELKKRVDKLEGKLKWKRTDLN
jgi:polyhydroxyalkanoate synthesis regulator phasin|tara:strand:+ start:58 stop:258 length:201 start_codon:yes stop_codon:yes gene_type:complete